LDHSLKAGFHYILQNAVKIIRQRIIQPCSVASIAIALWVYTER